MTPWMPIYFAALTLFQGDRQLDWEQAHRPAAFLYRMGTMMGPAIARFTCPPEAAAKLRRFTPPLLESQTHVLTAEEAQAGTLTLPFRLQGTLTAAACSVGTISEDEFGDPEYFPLPAEFNASAGTAQVQVTGLAPGTELTAEFYADGSFAADLNAHEQNILAYCLYLVWEHRWDNDAIQRALKARDSSFSTASEAAHTAADTERLRSADARLHDLMRAYAQLLEYEESSQ